MLDRWAKESLNISRISTLRMGQRARQGAKGKARDIGQDKGHKARQGEKAKTRGKGQDKE